MEYQEFPRMIYLHEGKDNSQDKIVHDQDELDAHLEQGWSKEHKAPEISPKPEIEEPAESIKNEPEIEVSATETQDSSEVA